MIQAGEEYEAIRGPKPVFLASPGVSRRRKRGDEQPSRDTRPQRGRITTTQQTPTTCGTPTQAGESGVAVVVVFTASHRPRPRITSRRDVFLDRKTKSSTDHTHNTTVNTKRGHGPAPNRLDQRYTYFHGDHQRQHKLFCVRITLPVAYNSGVIIITENRTLETPFHMNPLWLRIDFLQFITKRESRVLALETVDARFVVGTARLLDDTTVILTIDRPPRNNNEYPEKKVQRRIRVVFVTNYKY